MSNVQFVFKLGVEREGGGYFERGRQTKRNVMERCNVVDRCNVREGACISFR